MVAKTTRIEWDEIRKYIQKHRGIRNEMKILILKAIWRGVEIDEKVVWSEEHGTAGFWDEDMFFPVLVKCADCGLYTPASIECETTRMEGHNGIWADCPECDITGYDGVIIR